MSLKVVAQVWVNDVLAATISKHATGTMFEYRPEYLELTLPPVATTLPKTTDPVILPPGQLPPFFAGLLPEGRRLSALKRSVKTSADDELGLLLAVGGNTVGNISVLPVGETPEAIPGHVDLGADDLDFSRILTDAGIGDPHALAGVQDKASARTIALPAGGEVLIKLSPPEFPGLVGNEYACLQAYRRMSMARKNVIEASIVRDIHGMAGLAVRRFDGSFPNKFPVEDAAQLLGIYPADKYNVSFEDVCERVLAVVSAPALAARDLMLQLAFAWLSGNGDLHAKNISVIDRGNGFELAPVYDIPSTVPYGDRTLALPVRGSTTGLSRKRFIDVCASVGVLERLAHKIAEQALTATDALASTLIRATGADPRRARDITRILRSRRQHW